MKNLLGTILIIAWLTPDAAAVSGFAQAVSWRSAGDPQPLAQALYVIRMDKTQHISKMFLVAPSGARFVLTNRLAAGGIATVMLREEASGWWASLTHDYGTRKATLQELFAAHRIENIPEDMTIAISLQTAGKSFAVRDVHYGSAPAKADQAFLTALLRSDAAASVRSEIPDVVREELEFLDAALTDDANGLGFRKIVDILVALRINNQKPPKINVAVDERMKGWTLSAPEHVRFVSAFPSVRNPTDPTADP